jgi:hypothetical protein
LEWKEEEREEVTEADGVEHDYWTDVEAETTDQIKTTSTVATEATHTENGKFFLYSNL